MAVADVDGVLDRSHHVLLHGAQPGGAQADGRDGMAAVQHEAIQAVGAG